MAERRPFAVHRADHVGFVVGSLDSAIRVFVEGFGARLVRTGEKDGAFVTEVTGARGADLRTAMVDLAGFTIELLEYRGGDDRLRANPPYAPGMAHLALVVDDVAAVLARLDGFGWHPQGVPQAIPDGPSAGTLVTYVVGPSGETIELMQLPG